MSRAKQTEAVYRTAHSLYLGAELELSVEQHSVAEGYWLTIRETHGQEGAEELASYVSVPLEQLRRAADAFSAVVARLEREEEL